MVLKARYVRWSKDADIPREVWPVRFSREIEYLLYFLAGAAYLAYPSPTITEGLGSRYAAVWSGFLCFGGFLGLLALTKVVLFEYVCLPLLITSMGLFGIIAIDKAVDAFRAGDDDQTFIWVLGLVFLSVAFGLVARMRDVREQIEVQRAVRNMLAEQERVQEQQVGPR